MYQILNDGYVLYDPRDEEEQLIVLNPRCKLAVNTVGEASFSILETHPYYSTLKKLRSVVEIIEDGETIFRGRITEDTKDYDNVKVVDCEGVMAYFNDSIIKPFNFPDDFTSDSSYIEAANNGNVIEFFLSWVINQHNSQVQDFQKFKLGIVTVADANNYLSRSSTEYMKSWEVLKTKLFDSSLGGNLCIRYEEDGNYIDYLADFTEKNEQTIISGVNLLDLLSESDASETYTAILPLGKRKIDESSEDKSRLTIEELGDGEITDDIVKQGDTIYSKKAVAEHGWIYAPIEETTWDDVTQAANLQSNAVDMMQENALKMKNTVTIKAVDLHFSDEQIAAFRIYKQVIFEDGRYIEGVSSRYPLTELEIDIENPQNTILVLGDTRSSMTDINAGIRQNISSQAEVVKVTIKQELSKSEQTIVDVLTEAFSSRIEQLAENITLEISGSLGSKASVVLSVEGHESTEELDLTEIRKAFANDGTSVEISAGVVQFNSGTIIINSNNFKVSAEGVIEATSGTIGAITLSTTGIYSNNSTYSASYAGWYRPLTIKTTENCFFAGATDQFGKNAKFLVTYGGQLKATDAVISGEVTTVYSSYKAKLDGGGLELYFNDVLCGTVNTKYWSGASTEGISLRVEEGGNYIMFSHADDTQGSGYVVDYYLNAGWSSSYDEMHIFQTSARFLDDVYFAGYTRIRSLRLFNGSNEYLVGISSSGQLTVSKL